MAKKKENWLIDWEDSKDFDSDNGPGWLSKSKPVYSKAPGGSTYFGGSSNAGYTYCRHKPTFVFRSPDGIDFYGGSKMYIDARSVQGIDLVVCLLGRPELYKEPTLNGAPHWMVLNRYLDEEDVPIAEELVIDWRDGGILKGGRDFWEHFYSLIKERGYKKVLFFCLGGHGRTGIALAAMMTVTLNIHGGRAIKEVRDGYCKEAVETKAQETYLRELTKRVGK